jgi:hypothetical protein
MSNGPAFLLIGESPDGAGYFGIALLRESWTADTRRASERAKILRPRERRAHSLDPAVSGRRIHPGRDSVICSDWKSATTLMEVLDESQASRTRGLYRSSEAREVTD